MKLLKTLALAGIIAAAAIIYTTGAARALDIFGKSQQAPQGPTLAQQYPIQDMQGFQAVAKSFHRIPFKDPQLEFEILLPKDWTSDETAQGDTGGSLTRELMGDLARFKSPIINTTQAVVAIQSVKLTREISAENWLKNYILTSNYSLQDKVVPMGDKKATAHYVSTSEGKSIYVYISVQVNASNIVVVRFETPLFFKDAMNFTSKAAVDSFRFILATDLPIETQKNFSFPDALKFTFPESWEVNHTSLDDPRALSMQLYSKSKGEKIDGLIRFVVVKRNPATSLKKESDDLRKYFSDFLQLDFKKLVSSEKAPVTTNRFIFSRYEVYQAALKNENATEQELRLVVLGDKDWYIFAFLLTPTDTDNFYVWACNTQAFDEIIKKLK